MAQKDASLETSMEALKLVRKEIVLSDGKSVGPTIGLYAVLYNSDSKAYTFYPVFRGRMGCSIASCTTKSGYLSRKGLLS